MIEITETNFWPLTDHELEGSDSTLKVEISITSDRGDMSADPIYYAVYSRDDELVMDGHRAAESSHYDPMWRFVRHLVSETYDQKRLAMIQREHPAFEDDGKVILLQRRLDAEWARSVQL